MLGHVTNVRVLSVAAFQYSNEAFHMSSSLRGTGLLGCTPLEEAGAIPKEAGSMHSKAERAISIQILHYLGELHLACLCPSPATKSLAPPVTMIPAVGAV
eukprot:2459945-Amphidinium_carterae.1